MIFFSFVSFNFFFLKLVGARSDKEWFLKEIEITNLNTSVTWLCEFNCWLPKKDQEKHEKRYEIKSPIKQRKESSFDKLSGNIDFGHNLWRESLGTKYLFTFQ